MACSLDTDRPWMPCPVLGTTPAQRRAHDARHARLFLASAREHRLAGKRGDALWCLARARHWRNLAAANR